MQNYVEFNGGGRGIKSKANGVRGRPLQKNTQPYKKIHAFRNVCPQNDVLGIRIRRAYHITLGFSAAGAKFFGVFGIYILLLWFLYITLVILAPQEARKLDFYI